MPASASPTCQLSASEEQIYSSLSCSVSTLQSPIPSVVVITDIGKDYDDMAALLVLAELHRLSQIHLRAVVTNLMPAMKRAKVARRMLDLLGLADVPVGVGSRASATEYPQHSYEFVWEEDAISAMSDEDFWGGQELLLKAYTDAQDEGRKITLVLISSLTDIDAFAHANGCLFKETTASIKVQGYNEFKDGTLVAREDSPAANNRFDPSAAKRFHALIQDLCIPSTTFTKFVAYSTPLPTDIFVQLAATGHSIGRHLNWLHYEITKEFYAQSLQPILHKEDQTPQLVLNTRTSWFETHGTEARLPKPEELEPYLKLPILYDAIAALGVLRPESMDALARVESSRWGVRLPFEPNMRETIHGEVGQASEEDTTGTFHRERVALIISALMKGALLHAQLSLMN